MSVRGIKLPRSCRAFKIKLFDGVKIGNCILIEAKIKENVIASCPGRAGLIKLFDGAYC